MRKRLQWMSTRPDVAAAVGRRESGFLYRPGEIVIDAGHASDLQYLISDEFGATEIDGRTGHHRRKYGNDTRLTLDRLDLTHLALPDGLDVTRTVELLRLTAHAHGFHADVSANHIYITDQNRQFWPATVPQASRTTVRPAEGDAGYGVVVGVLDTGVVRGAVNSHVRIDRNDIDPSVKRGVIGNVQGGHGTFVSWQVLRVAPGATIDPEASCDHDGVTNDVEVAADLHELTRRARVVNLSLGGYTQDNVPPTALARAIAEFQERDGEDVVFVASAGNDGTSQPSWPAAFKNVVAVAAVDRRRRPATFSNHGPWVDCCALGVDVDDYYVTGSLTTPDEEVREFDGTARWSGTSFAAPRVSGAIAAKLASGATDSARVAAAMVIAESKFLPGERNRAYGRYVAT